MPPPKGQVIGSNPIGVTTQFPIFPSHTFALDFPRDFKDLLDGGRDRDAPLPPIDRLDCPSSLLANSVGAVLYGFP